MSLARAGKTRSMTGKGWAASNIYSSQKQDRKRHLKFKVQYEEKLESYPELDSENDSENEQDNLETLEKQRRQFEKVTKMVDTVEKLPQRVFNMKRKCWENNPYGNKISRPKKIKRWTRPQKVIFQEDDGKFEPLY